MSEKLKADIEEGLEWKGILDKEKLKAKSPIKPRVDLRLLSSVKKNIRRIDERQKRGDYRSSSISARYLP